MKKPQLPAALTRPFAFLRRLPLHQRALVGTLLVLVTLAVMYLAYSLSFLNRAYPNVLIGDTHFTHQTQSQVKATLTQLIADNQNQPIKLSYQDSVTSVAPSDVSWQLDTDQTAQAVVAVGHTNGFWPSFYQQIKSPFVREQVTPTVSYDHDLLDKILTNATGTIDQPAVDATAKFVADKLILNKEVVGKKVNRDQVTDQILGGWNQFSPDDITLTTEFDPPKVVLGDEATLRSQVDQLSQTKLVLTWPNSKKTLNTSDIHQLIDFTGTGGSDGSAATLQASFTNAKTKSYLEALSTNGINQPAKDAKLIIKDGALAVSQASAEGRVVDLEASATTVLAALQSSESNKTAELTLKDQDPVIRESNLAQLGIKELIGRGETSFVGSPANRKVNIANGVSLLSSALVKPGDQFSTVGALGRVDDTTGFLPELVIKENETTPEFGGGLCQVSTTLFRAVMNAGLKVTERQNHSYRVSYYEPPIGLDATIYLPKPDFKFLNDTPNYVLIQGQVVGSKVIFELWGTKDGRTSTISDPVVSNFVDPPDPIYAETDTLPKGTTKQIEHAHQGATAVATYTVYRDGQVINKQVFKSIYKPWQARFLVGTHEDPPPPPTS